MHQYWLQQHHFKRRQAYESTCYYLLVAHLRHAAAGRLGNNKCPKYLASEASDLNASYS
jgi:hypothetical protein